MHLQIQLQYHEIFLQNTYFSLFSSLLTLKMLELTEQIKQLRQILSQIITTSEPCQLQNIENVKPYKLRQVFPALLHNLACIISFMYGCWIKIFFIYMAEIKKYIYSSILSSVSRKFATSERKISPK